MHKGYDLHERVILYMFITIIHSSNRPNNSLFQSMTHPGTCIYTLLSPPRDPDLVRRLRHARTFPALTNGLHCISHSVIMECYTTNKLLSMIPYHTIVYALLFVVIRFNPCLYNYHYFARHTTVFVSWLCLIFRFVCSLCYCYLVFRAQGCTKTIWLDILNVSPVNIMCITNCPVSQ